MARAFKLKTFPEIRKGMVNHIKANLGDDIDENDLAVIMTILDACAFQDADQWDQIARLLDLFSLDETKGDDLDRRVRDYGSDFFKPLRRQKAKTSLAQITASDGAKLVKTSLSADVPQGNATFSVAPGTGNLFPAAGYVWLERGTARSEQVVYTRVGDVFTMVPKPGDPPGLLFNHTFLGEVLLLATRSHLAVPAPIGTITITLSAGTGAGWPTVGTVILDRGTLNEEKQTFTRVGDVLTLPQPALKAHALGSTAILSTSGTDRSISQGTVCFVPPTDSGKQVNFRTTAPGKLYDGDLTSDLIPVESELPGLDTRVGANTITAWQSPPFAGATVTNPLGATRGADREEDEDYVRRVKEFIQSLTRATPLAITTLVISNPKDGGAITDPVTGQQVAFAEIVEPVAPGKSILYITDGTQNFSLTKVAFNGRDILINDAVLGDRRGKLNQYAPFNVLANPPNLRTPRLFKSVVQGVATSVGVNFLEDNTAAMVVNAHVGRWLKTDDGQFFQILANTAIRFTLIASGATPSLGSYAVFDFSVAPLVPGVDYQFNESKGDFELAVALPIHGSVVAASDGAPPNIGAYTYTTGLGATVQRAVNGDPAFFDDYPGFRAAGTQILVTAPTIIVPTFTIQVVAAAGFSDATLRPLVKQVVQVYVNSLGIGARVILSEIIRLVKGIPGVYDVTILSPLANIPVGDGRLARCGDADITVV